MIESDAPSLKIQNSKTFNMKNVALFTTMMFAFGLTASAQKVNEKIQIESSGAWYNGKILEVKGDQYLVTYDDWGSSWDEWVGMDRIKLLTKPAAPASTGKYKVGDRVEVEYGMVPEPATVIEVGENKYHIQYDKKSFKSKWVTEGQIKKL